MEIILNNYLYIIIIGGFIIFSLIGYLVETIKKPKVTSEDNKKINIKQFEDVALNCENKPLEKTREINNEKIVNIDDLLDDYNNE